MSLSLCLCLCVFVFSDNILKIEEYPSVYFNVQSREHAKLALRQLGCRVDLFFQSNPHLIFKIQFYAYILYLFTFSTNVFILYLHFPSNFYHGVPVIPYYLYLDLPVGTVTRTKGRDACTLQENVLT